MFQRYLLNPVPLVPSRPAEERAHRNTGNSRRGLSALRHKPPLSICGRLQVASLLGFLRRCRYAIASVLPAQLLDMLEGSSQKIDHHGLLPNFALQRHDFRFDFPRRFDLVSLRAPDRTQP